MRFEGSYCLYVDFPVCSIWCTICNAGFLAQPVLPATRKLHVYINFNLLPILGPGTIYPLHLAIVTPSDRSVVRNFCVELCVCRVCRLTLSDHIWHVFATLSLQPCVYRCLLLCTRRLLRISWKPRKESSPPRFDIGCNHGEWLLLRSLNCLLKCFDRIQGCSGGHESDWSSSVRKINQWTDSEFAKCRDVFRF